MNREVSSSKIQCFQFWYILHYNENCKCCQLCLFLKIKGGSTLYIPRHCQNTIWPFFKIIKVTECGNFINFLSLRFYVKSIWEIKKNTKSPISTPLEALNCYFYDVSHFLKAKFTKLKHSVPALFNLLDSSLVILLVKPLH